MKLCRLLPAALLILFPVAVHAQVGTPADTVGLVGDTARARELRQRVEQRFAEMVQNQLQLSEPEMRQLKGAMRAHQERRRDLSQRERAVQMAMRGQMQPGVAANADSVNRLLDSQARLRVERAQQEAQLERDLGFLAPVKRAQFLMMMRNFEQRVQDVRRRGMMGGGFRGQGQGQGGVVPPAPVRPNRRRP